MFLSIITRVYYLDIYPFTKFFVESPFKRFENRGKDKRWRMRGVVGKKKKKKSQCAALLKLRHPVSFKAIYSAAVHARKSSRARQLHERVVKA